MSSEIQLAHILEVPQPPTTYFDIGKTIHFVIQQLTQMQKDGIKPTEETALKLMKEIRNSNSFDSETQENQAKQNAENIIKNYLQCSWEVLKLQPTFQTKSENYGYSGGDLTVLLIVLGDGFSPRFNLSSKSNNEDKKSSLQISS